MIATIRTRRSIRQWSPEPVDGGALNSLLEAAMCAPSAMNRQPWQFVVLTGKALSRTVSINRNTPPGAPAAILVCLDESVDKGSGRAVQDCSAATENILLAAHTMGLGAVWTAVFPDRAHAAQARPSKDRAISGRQALWRVRKAPCV